MQWIKCTESLPPFDKEIICMAQYKTYRSARVLSLRSETLVQEDGFERLTIYFEDVEGSHYQPIINISHWAYVIYPEKEI